MLTKTERLLILRSLFLPILFTVLIWVVKIIELMSHYDFASFGVYPLKASGLIGILTAPLIHSDINHILSNTFAVFFLTWAMCYFYKEIAKWAFILIYILSGLWVWFFAREAYHIGASGLIYGLASFLFFSGVFRKHVPLAALSLVIVFLYGGIIWGVFPTFSHISWETHLTGLIAGIITAIYYKNEGPQKPKSFEDESDELDDENQIDNFPNSDFEINYHFKETQKD